MTRQIFLFTDLDGTLEDSRQDMAESANRVREKLGLAQRDIEVLKQNVNRGMTDLYLSCFDDYLKDSAIQTKAMETVRLAYEENYLANVTNHTKLYDGVFEALKTLSQKAKLVLVTNKPTHISEQLLKNLGVSDCYVKIMGGDSCGETKPSPLPLQLAAKEFGFNAELDTAFMWGDTLADIRAGKAFGAKTIWCSWGYLASPAPEQPDHSIHHPQELISIILGQNP